MRPTPELDPHPRSKRPQPSARSHLLSFFAQNACKIAPHVRINDETNTPAGGAPFNQEDVPGETLFYGVVHPFAAHAEQFKRKSPEQALTAFSEKLKAAGHLSQFGGDVSTGLGLLHGAACLSFRP